MDEVVLFASEKQGQCPGCSEVGYESIMPADGCVVCSESGGAFPVEKVGVVLSTAADEVEVALPAVQLAGLMALATDRAFSPDAVAKYRANRRLGLLPDTAPLHYEERNPSALFGDKRERRSTRVFSNKRGAIDWVSKRLTAWYL